MRLGGELMSARIWPIAVVDGELPQVTGLERSMLGDSHPHPHPHLHFQWQSQVQSSSFACILSLAAF